ncbi:DNA-binding response regulator [Comamonas aquatica]|uniref:response regulator transcription factor n=1 Tax=Comamonas aquatica TaxID=225991 RepID=UPI0005ED335E|nr:response regulator transcription factor [Comamonas aquatica]ANY62899.1 DNA-binding response regulator [Comamonas aquatica]
MKHILLIEDDAAIAEYISSNLCPATYQVVHVTEANSGLQHALSRAWDCILLDRMLPMGVDGLDVLKALRAVANTTPTMVVSALGQTDERVRCLKAGADDYLPKPFIMEELEARIEALVRRTATSTPPASHVLQLGDLQVDLIAHAVFRAGERIALNPREFKLLGYLLKNAGQTVTRAMVLENVWAYDFQPETNIIDVHISHLRQKIDVGGVPSLIRTVRGMGYRIDVPVAM